jgi:large subunit ribosomal protein L15
MQINTLKLSYKRKKRKTIGRGGKKGTYSGKGNKGQKARSGAHVNPLFEGGRSTLIDHMKKKKGFKAVRGKVTAVDLAMLSKKMKDGGPVNAETLIKAGFVDRIEARRGIKLVGVAEIKQKFQVEKTIQTSAGAKQSIEKAGGSVETK